MSDLIDIAAFRSGRFAPVLPEDSQVNPEVYGAELAYWLCLELAGKGVVTSYPEYEDWGWYVEYFTSSGSEFALHCINVEGAKDHWQIQLRRHARKMFGRDKPPLSEASPLLAGLKALLESEPSILDLSWHAPDDLAG